MPAAPCGIAKFNTAACDVPLLVTVACEPAARVVTVPTLTVAAAPCTPVAPVLPAWASTTQLDGYRSGSALPPATCARYVDPAKVTASFTAYSAAAFHTPRKFIPTAPGAPVAPVAPFGPVAPCGPAAPAAPARRSLRRRLQSPPAPAPPTPRVEVRSLPHIPCCDGHIARPGIADRIMQRITHPELHVPCHVSPGVPFTPFVPLVPAGPTGRLRPRLPLRLAGLSTRSCREFPGHPQLPATPCRPCGPAGSDGPRCAG